jgi:hypothetical protein
MATLVDYSDLDFQPISSEQYEANLHRQIALPNLPLDLSVKQLEGILDERNQPRSYLPKMIHSGYNISPLIEDIQWLIWKTYNSTFVMKELVLSQKFLWELPSRRLISVCKDPGCIQQGHSGLEDMIEDENMWAWKACQETKCVNCKLHGFPCATLAWHGFRNDYLEELWEPNFV